MIRILTIVLVILASALLAKFYFYHINPALYSNSTSLSSIAPPKTEKIDASTTGTPSDTAFIAYKAVDRECGSCHHGGRSTNTKALAVYNLLDSCWYCKLAAKQITAFGGRMRGSGFSEEEKNAIQTVLKSHLMG